MYISELLNEKILMEKICENSLSQYFSRDLIEPTLSCMKLLNNFMKREVSAMKYLSMNKNHDNIKTEGLQINKRNE